ncbi:hypothetical protein C8R44DRAFT_889846 [Mycena epipterygia]|nr:hypothetical protein C8R44DRAFT_889846 [Mycena epipterygia]
MDPPTPHVSLNRTTTSITWLPLAPLPSPCRRWPRFFSIRHARLAGFCWETHWMGLGWDLGCRHEEGFGSFRQCSNVVASEELDTSAVERNVSQDNYDDQEHGQHRRALSPHQHSRCSSMSSPSSCPMMMIGSGQHRWISSSLPPSRRRRSYREVGDRPPYNGAQGMAALAARSKEQGR